MNYQEELYKLVLKKGNTLKASDLLEIGFNYKIINELIERNIIKRESRGIYSFENKIGIYNHGFWCKKNKDYDLSMACFEYALANGINISGSAFELFQKEVYKNNLEKAFEYFEIVYQANELDKNLLDFILYLLNACLDIPEKYIKIIKNMTYEQLSTKGEVEIDVIKNRIIANSLKGNFAYSYKVIDDYAKNNKPNKYDALIRILLFKAKTNDLALRDKLKDLVTKNDLNGALAFLKLRNDKGLINHSEIVFVKLIQIIIDLKTGKTIEINSSTKSETVFEAIDNNDFKAALELNNRKMQTDQKNGYAIIFSSLLTQINDLISKKEVVVEDKEESFCEDELFQEFITQLMSKEVSKATDIVFSYLKLKNMSLYSNYIVDLMKLSLLKKDVAFTSVMKEMFRIKDGTFEFDTKEYLQKFYFALSQNCAEEAKIYYQMIERYGMGTIDLGQLQEIMNKYENVDTVSKKEEKIDEVIPCKEEKAIAIDPPKKDEEKVTEKIVKNREILKVEITPDERKSFEAKREKLLIEHGLILYKPLSKEARQKIYRLSKEYPNVCAFGIGGDVDVKPVVLKYCSAEYVNKRQYHCWIVEANDLYHEKKFTKALAKYLEIISHGKTSSFIYARVGLTYMYIGNIKEAITYLTIANMLEDRQHDYTELIMNLQNPEPKSERKPKFIMMEHDFENAFDSEYTYESFVDFVQKLQANGIDIESGCVAKGLSKDEIDKVIILCAKVFYMQGYVDKGNEFIKYFLQKENKSKKNLELANEIVHGKKFYIAQRKAPTLSLVLKTNTR